jgi:hypothetical protein
MYGITDELLNTARQSAIKLWRQSDRSTWYKRQVAFDKAMEEADRILYGCGVEPLRIPTDQHIEYVNLGDAYTNTIVGFLGFERASFRIQNWGDIAERFPNC